MDTRSNISYTAKPQMFICGFAVFWLKVIWLGCLGVITMACLDKWTDDTLYKMKKCYGFSFVVS
ncbi:hypothetical protein B0182_10620 [Moraxella bovis]|uniref:Uncharacterized protein n=1 Tax=Moraxella equi TaxID=60442 RepID=A0ABX3NLY1_9GAMM|nr:hypothetical protein DQF64_14145 [Moraxella bovis]OOR88142.1 hypothetical protein B0182_10620 [Moraxella bovis]OPH39790.1 hypothetical protein B5J93_02520 [Moraxella equi]